MNFNQVVIQENKDERIKKNIITIIEPLKVNILEVHIQLGFSSFGVPLMFSENLLNKIK